MPSATQLPRAVDSTTLELVCKTIKGLAMDGVEQAGSGHPGMPMGTAEMAATLWMRFLRHDPAQPDWPDRDRFVLSAGHGSMLLYSLLHLTGYELPMSELQRFRQLNSLTPGHPEVDHTPGVEVTTGPLGSGFAAGVGLAMGERFMAARYNRDGHTIIDHHTYGIVSDGDLMEGIASEAASMAGHLGLGKLIYLYDANQITIDGGTDLSFTEDVGARFRAYGWDVDAVDGHDPDAIAAALTKARAQTEKPSLIVCRTTIARGAPTKAGTSKSHGAPLGAEEVAGAKRAMGWPEDEAFHVPSAVSDALGAARTELGNARVQWQARFDAYAAAHTDAAMELLSLWSGDLVNGTIQALEAVTFEAGTKLATRKAGLKILGALAAAHPTVLGGSADLAGSNGVGIPDGGEHSKENPSGRNVHFGVREHGMAGICNGLALHGGIRPFDATFLIFSDFMRGALRLSALMQLPVVHVLSHDSILVGEDGPTHQPVEQCMSLRLIPGLHVVRPADANETVGAWIHAMKRGRGDGPTAILVTRQGLPVNPAARRDISEGAYVIWEPEGATADTLDGILVATGSEVHLCIEAAQALSGDGVLVRVVSMPCWKAFAEQPAEYRESVLPAALTKRLSVEAGTTMGWDRWAQHQHGIDRFGASAPGGDIAEHFGFTTAAIIKRYRALA